jgi:hypothetical protein
VTTLASDLVNETHRHLFTGQPEILNRLASGVAAGDTTLPFTYDLRGIQVGAVIAVDLEEIFVFAADSSAKTVTDCIRGYNGSIPASHSATTPVVVAPKFSSFRVLEAINHDLRDLSSPVNSLYQIKTLDITFNPTRFGYDLAGVTSILSVAEVRYRTPGPERTWPRITAWTMERNMPATGTYGDFPSGFALIVHEAAFPGYPIRVRYKAPFDLLAGLTDNVGAVSGLPDTAADIPPLGAAVRLALGREIRRNFDEAQGEPRRAEEVPPQAAMNATRGLQLFRQQRIQAEAARLNRHYSYETVG